MRGYLHQAAFYSSLGAGLMLIAMARSGASQVAAVIYVCSLTCYLESAPFTIGLSGEKRLGNGSDVLITAQFIF